MKTDIYIYIFDHISLISSQNAKCTENLNTHFVFNKVCFFFPRKSCSLCDNVENNVEQGRVFACCIPKAIHTHSELYRLFHCNNGWASTPQCYVIRTLFVLL